MQGQIAFEITVFAIAFVATAIGSVTGGSTSLITTPCWLSFGIPLPTALAADKTAATMWTAVASRNFLRGKKLDLPLLFGLMAFGMIGAVLGTKLTTSIDQAITKRIVGALVLILIGVSWLRKDFGVTEREPILGRFLTALTGLPLGFYEGFFGSGNTILSSLAFCKLRGWTLTKSLGHYYLLALIWCATAAISYAGQGFFDIKLTVPATLGAITGAYVGSRYASRVGEKKLKVMFSTVGVIFGVKLVSGF